MTTWISQGPDPILGGGNVFVDGKGQVGALAAVVPHPTNADILWVGAINGGIWKTTNATAATPIWTTTTDNASSLSITSLDIDPANLNNLVAGIGRRSSLSSVGGALTGLLITTDGGTTWTPPAGNASLQGYNIYGVAIRGNTILAAARDQRDVNGELIGNGALWRSADAGNTFTQVNVFGLTERGYTDIAADPTNPNRFYVAARAVANSTVPGVFVTSDGGATWQQTAAIPELTDATTNVKLSVGSNGQVYVGVVNRGLAAVYRSADQGTNWTAMNVPTTTEGPNVVGIHPGGQGSLHFSIVADSTNDRIVYVGGDAQPQLNNDFPNSIGALSYTGRLFRGILNADNTTTWTAITSNFADPDGAGPLLGTAPHADSRDMAFDANGNLLEVDDGGIYRRTAPQTNTGLWQSMMGVSTSSGLRTTEFHSIEWDARSKSILGGAQDNGVAAGRAQANQPWNEVAGGDGGQVEIDDRSPGQNSIWYYSSQKLGNFAYREVSPTGNVVSTVYPTLVVKTANRPTLRDYERVDSPFYTPIKLNAVNPTWLIILGSKGVYESQGERATDNNAETQTIILTDLSDRRINNADNQNVRRDNDDGAIAYGGRRNGVANPYVLYVGTARSREEGGQEGALYQRTTQDGRLNQLTQFPSQSPVRDIALDPNNWHNAYALTASNLYRTTDAGITWTDITGDLAAAGKLVAGSFRSVEYVAGGQDGVMVSGLGGVFSLQAPNTTNAFTWSRLGTGLPNLIGFEIDYDADDDVLVVGTLGRGAWILQQVRSVFGGTSPTPPAPPATGGTPNLTVSDAGAAENVDPNNAEPQSPDDEVADESNNINEDEILPTLTFVISLDRPSDMPVTVTVNTRDGTAIAGQDYVAIVNQQVTFEPGQTLAEVFVDLINGNDAESNESLFLDVTGAINATVIDGEGQGSIYDDDTILPEPTLGFDTQNNIFTINGEPEQSITGTFTLTQNNSSFRNEVGFFVVDDQNQVFDVETGEPIGPNSPSYITSALLGGVVLFSTLPDAGTLGLTNLARQAELFGGDRLVFYLVSNGTTDEVIRGQVPTSQVLLANASSRLRGLQVTNPSTGNFTLSWEDTPGGGDRDFNDVVLSFRLETTPVSVEKSLQGIVEAELVDLFQVDLNNDGNADTRVTASFQVTSEAAFKNTVGFYRVDNDEGLIGTLAPGGAGYAQAALQRRVLEFDRSGTAPITITGESLGLLAPFIIANGTVQEFLAQNVSNSSTGNVLAYFPFVEANPDQVDHIRLLGDNAFGFEDILGGGDRDYNDIVFKAQFVGV